MCTVIWPHNTNCVQGKRSGQNSVTECNSRISHGSITSSCVSDAPYDQPSGSTDECAACAVHLKERSKHTCCWTTSSIDTSPCNSPAAHVQRGHSVEGQLRNVKVAIYVDPLQPTRQLTIHAVAQYHGSSSNRLSTSWRYRSVELARCFVKELLYAIHYDLETRWRGKSEAQCVWRRNLINPNTSVDDSEAFPMDALMKSDDFTTFDLCDIKDVPQTPSNDNHFYHQTISPRDTDSMYSMRSVASFECASTTEIGARIIDVEWGRGFRWGGDDEYDSDRDGMIHIEGMCVMPDPRPQPPVWVDNVGHPQQPLFEDVESFAHSISNLNRTVAFGLVKNRHRDDAETPWRIAQFESRHVQVRIPLDWSQ